MVVPQPVWSQQLYYRGLGCNEFFCQTKSSPKSSDSCYWLNVFVPSLHWYCVIQCDMIPPIVSGHEILDWLRGHQPIKIPHIPPITLPIQCTTTPRLRNLQSDKQIKTEQNHHNHWINLQLLSCKSKITRFVSIEMSLVLQSRDCFQERGVWCDL